MLKLKRKTTNLQRTAFMSMLMMLSVIMFSMFMFTINVTMSVYSIIVPIALIAIYCVLCDRELLSSLIICVIFLALWCVVCSRFIDYSYDGMYYHKEAIITLSKGWNPIYQSCSETEPLNLHADLALWLDNYPKGIWIFSAALYMLTGYLETAKAVNILFIILLFCTANDTLRSITKFKNGKCTVFSIIICLNPLFISQIFTSYNDLAVGTLTMTAVFLGMKIYSETATATDYSTLFCVTAMSCLVKFTAPLLVGITLIAYGLGYIIKLHGKKLTRSLKKPLIVIISGFLAGVIIFGFDPYMKHLIHGQNMLYPVLGEDSYDIMNNNPPKDFEGKSTQTKFFISLFSKVDNEAGGDYELKIPFTVHKSEFEHLGNADIRLSGFGLLFSGIMLVSILLAAVAALKKRKMRAELAIGLILFALLALFFPESWWARYVSTTYYIPVFLMIFASGCSKTRRLSSALALLIAVNSVLSAVFVIRSAAAMTSYFNSTLNDIKATGKKIEIRINDFPSHLAMFEEKGIEYRVAESSMTDATVFYQDTKFRYIK